MLLEKKKYLQKNPSSLRGLVSELSLSDEWTESTESLLIQLQSTMTERQKLSRTIGSLKKENRTIDGELRQMQQLSQQIKQLENDLETALSEGEKQVPQLNQMDNTAVSEKPDAASDVTGEPTARLPAFMRSEAATKQPAEDSQSESGSTRQITITGDFDDADWTEYVSARSDAHIYHDLRWRKVIESCFSQKTAYLLAKDRDRVVGVLPLAELQSALFGKFLISLPYFNYGGPLADNNSVAMQLIRAAGKLSTERGLEYLELRELADRSGLQTKTHKVSMILRLPESGEALMSGLGAKLRSQARRAEREGAVTRFGGVELLDSFYHVFCRNMRDLGTPVYSRKFFRNILETFPEETCLHVVEVDGSPAAAGFLITHRDSVEIPWASSLRRYNHLSVNMLLYRSVLEWSIDQGFKFFDFGRSSVDASTYRFKRQWGSEPVQLHWNYYLEGSQTLPSLSPDNPKFALFIAVWKRLPVMLSNAIGPHIVRNLP